MYEYVTKREVAEYRAYCSDALNRLKMKLEKDHGIEAYVTLIGSGTENMVTRNGKGPFDLDYNLILSSVPREYEKSLKKFKDLVRTTLDSVVDGRFKYGKDSTSSITNIVHAKDGKTVLFSFDVALIQEDGGKCRLIHDKDKGVLIWNQIRDSGNMGEKAAMIKDRGRWKDVRDAYLDLKNRYLKDGDKHHPSFVVYIEAVNQVYYAMGLRR